MTSPYLFSSFTSFTTMTITYNLYVHTLPRNTSYTWLSPTMVPPISSSISQSHNLPHNFPSFFLNYYCISTRHDIGILYSTIFSWSLSPSDFTPSLLYLNLMIPVSSAGFQIASSLPRSFGLLPWLCYKFTTYIFPWESPTNYIQMKFLSDLLIFSFFNFCT